MITEVLDAGWKDVTDERRAVVDFLRDTKPRLQQMLDDYNCSQGSK
jgi:hypothetical protein